MLRALLLWLSLLLAWPAQAQPSPHPGDPLRVSLLTFAPGETYWARFGHNALLVENTSSGANAVYNYGMFDFFQKNFFLNFARGHMQYRLDVDTLESTLRLYASEGRWVRQQVLNLSPEQRLALARFLDRNAQPDQAEYRYDYFRDNCSTRVRDAIDGVLGGALAQRLKAEPVAVSYRFEATRLMRPVWPLALGMDAIMGPAGDQPITRWEQSFVPEVLMAAIAEQQLDGAPLVAETHELVADTGRFAAPAEPLRWTGLALATGTALALLLLLAGQSPARWPFAVLAAPLLLIAGLGGLILLAVWGLTEHWSMHANWNLWLFSPIALLLIPLAWAQPAAGVLRRDRRAALWRSLIWLLLLQALLSAVLHGQVNTPWLALWLPVQLALGLGLLRRI